MTPKLTDLTCPDCRGTIWEIPRGNGREYRCRVGHTFCPRVCSPNTSRHRKRLFTRSVVALEEGASLAQALADQFDPEVRERLQEEARQRELQPKRSAQC